MTHNDIMVLAWPAIGVAAMCLFGWFMSGWIDRTYPRKPATSAAVAKGKSVGGALPAAHANRGPEQADGLDQLSERLARLQSDSARHALDIRRLEALIAENFNADQSSLRP